MPPVYHWEYMLLYTFNITRLTVQKQGVILTDIQYRLALSSIEVYFPEASTCTINQ